MKKTFFLFLILNLLFYAKECLAQTDKVYGDYLLKISLKVKISRLFRFHQLCGCDYFEAYIFNNKECHYIAFWPDGTLLNNSFNKYSVDSDTIKIESLGTYYFNNKRKIYRLDKNNQTNKLEKYKKHYYVKAKRLNKCQEDFLQQVNIKLD